MRHINIDIETFSPEPIKRTGLYKYAQHPEFEVLLFAYSLDNAPVQVVDMACGEEISTEVQQCLFDPHCLKHAFNAAFEWYCLSRYFGLSTEAAIAWLQEWRCTMLHGLYCGFAASLDATGKAIGLPQSSQKLSVGTALIRYFCTPCKPTKANGGRMRNFPQHDEAKWRLFKEYNAQDVVAEQTIEQKLSNFPVPDFVQQQWVLDQVINLRGVAVDRHLLQGALYCGEVANAALKEEAKALTGLQNPKSTAQLLRWLRGETGLDLTDVRKETVQDLLSRNDLGDKVTRVLQIRQELGKTSTKKYDAIEECVGADGRVRGLMQFYGANRTGREAGRLVQVQNLPHDTIVADDVARKLVKENNVEALRAVYGGIPAALSALIRTVLIPAEGSLFVDADFSAIEARVIAWLAGEAWVLDVFRTHGKIYEAAASQMFGIPFEKIRKGEPEYAYRKKGKVATLALGYQGGPGALVNMGALRSGLQEDELPDIVSRWRKSNPAIVRFWYDIDRAAFRAVTSGAATTVGFVTVRREIDPTHGLDFMTVQLPSGRKLYYAYPHIGQNRFGKDSVCYYGMNQTSKKWEVVETYGGKLVENITQAVARDCLFFAMENVEAAGYPIVFDVHDEVILEVAAASASLAEVVRILSQPAPWAIGLPLNADGWVGEYFKKD